MNKKKVISFRVTDEEARAIQRTAKQKKMSRSSYIAQCCLHPKIDAQTFQSRLRVTNTLRKSINKLKKNYLEPQECIRVMEDLLNEINN